MCETIEVKGVTVTFDTSKGPVCAVKNINATFEEGEVTGLIGESGSGKSVLGMAMLKLLAANAHIEGEYLYQGKNLIDLTEKEMEQLRGQELALIPQNPSESLNPVLKIRRQLVEAVTVHKPKAKAEAEKRSMELLQRLGFEEPDAIGNQYSFQLSGGMNQRVISALGLMCRPKWVIADEPTKGLDAILRRQVYEVLLQMTKQETRNMILITHDVALARKLSQKILVLYKGEILEQGDAEDVLEHPKHPYTRGLIGSLPKNGMRPIDQPRKDREGQENGCIFYSRCSYATERCGSKHPEETAVGGRWRVRCFLYA